MRKKIYIGILLLGVLAIGGVSGLAYRGGQIKESVPQIETEQESIENENREELENTENVLVFSSDINMDILSRHGLPGFERMKEEDQMTLVDSLQVIKKAEALGIEKERFLYPELNLIETEEKCAKNKIDRSDCTKQVVYEGNSSVELQKLIEENPNTVIEIRSEYIEVTESIYLKNHTYLIGNGVNLIGKGVKFIFLADSIEGIFLDSVQISGEAEYGIYIVNSKKIAVQNSLIRGLEQKAVCIVGENQFIEIQNNIFQENGAGGIWISGNTSYCLIEENEVSGNYGTSNWMAGIVLTNIELQDPMNIWQTFDDAHHFPYKENLYTQTKCPYEIIVRGNKVLENNASGIYSDGAYLCYIVENQVKENDKEGICLDYGTIGFYLKENIFDGNGERKRQTDEDLRMDFVLDAGKMENGSAKSKLPGVSLDNTAYNILENNVVINNFGGGIKMVRTTVRSLIMENIIKDNNKGQNDVFHFFGVEVGAAVADVESTDMDFTPDYENIICRNIISGDHYSGVFIGEECYVNDVFDNVIMEPQMFAIEAISLQFNSIVNNISNSGVRNEYQ